MPLVVELLSADLIRSILNFDLSFVSKDEMSTVRSLVRRLDDADIDQQLTATKDELRRAALLAIISGLGSTPRRMEVFCDLLPVGLAWMAVGSKLDVVIDNFWGFHAAELLRALASAVAKADLEDRDHLFMAGALLRDIPNRMTKELAEQVVMPVLQKSQMMPRAERILQLWCDIGFRSRPD
ncbi:hypothetical protein BO221_02890 [Archangium sp. Cb G35]|nr:hypothetical protein BO221_02890 [Archangium sp. Cb G35]